MTQRRSRAYGRIVRGPRTSAALEQITADQRERLRDAADALVLAGFRDEATRLALASARAVLLKAGPAIASRGSNCSPLTSRTQDQRPPIDPSMPAAARSITALAAQTSPRGDDGYPR